MLLPFTGSSLKHFNFVALVKLFAAFYRVFFETLSLAVTCELFAAFYRVFFETLSLVLLFSIPHYWN